MTAAAASRLPDRPEERSGGTTPVPTSLPADSPFKWRVVEVLSRSPVGMTAQEVADKLTPRHNEPFTSAADYRAWRDIRVNTPKKVTSALGKLTLEGHVQPAGNPRLDPAELALFLDRGWERFRHVEHVVDDGWIVGRTVTEPPKRERFRRLIVEALAQEPAGVPYALLLELTGGTTKAGRELRTWRRAFKDLVDAGTVIPSRARLPTLKGLQALRRL